VQKLLIQLLGHSSWYMDFSNLGTLDATFTLKRARGTGLPNDQWKIEVISHESKVWAVLQILLADYAIGAQVTEPNAYKYIDPPTTPAQKLLCHSMRMRKPGGFA